MPGTQQILKVSAPILTAWRVVLGAHLYPWGVRPFTLPTGNYCSHWLEGQKAQVGPFGRLSVERLSKELQGKPRALAPQLV